MASIQKQINDLKQDINDIIAGYYTQPTSLGPNTLSKNSVKARSIRSGNIDVSNLEAVQTKTGNLTVDGNLTIGTGGSLRSGKTSYSDVSNAGFWIGIDSAIPKIRVGNIGHTSGWTWDGTTLAISGTVTATSGTIGGWTIGSTDLTADGGATGIASSGSYRIWTGDANPANAEFSVTSAGALKSTSGTIGGWTINGISGFYLGSGASQRGIDTGSTTFYAGSSTPSLAPFNVSSSGVLNATGATITGNITASSLSISGTASFAGGTMLLPNGGSITASNVDLNQGTIGNMTVDGTLTVNNDIIVSTSGKIQSGKTTYGSGTGWLLEYNSGIPRIDIGGTTRYLRWDGSNLNIKGNVTFVTSGSFGDTLLLEDTAGNDLLSIYGSTSGVSLQSIDDLDVILGDSAGADTFGVFSSIGALKFAVASNGAILIDTSNGDISVNTNTPGATFRAWAIRNAAGTVWGYLPVYSAPW